MQKVSILIFFLFLCYNVVAQQRFPTGVPTQFSTGFFKQGYHQSDSGTIIANRDTNWLAKYSGTVVFRPANKKFYYFDSTTLTWNQFGTVIDTTSLNNRINLKLSISDTVGQWLAQSTRLVDSMYRVNDSTVGYTIKGNPYTFQILGRLPSGGGGSGTVTSVGLSMPSAFTVSTPNPITSSGTFNVFGAGTTADYIRGNGTLATTDTGMIPNFHLKVRSLFSGTSPLTYNSTTGIFGVGDANTAGTKGVATFASSAFTDNGSGLINLVDVTTAGTCINCDITFDAKGRATSYASGTPPQFVNASGAGDTLSISDTLKRLNNGYGILHVVTANNITHSVDTSSSNSLVTQYDISQLGVTADNGLTKTGSNIQLGGTLLQNTTIGAGSLYNLAVTASGSITPFSVTHTGSGNGVFINTFSGTGSALSAQSNNSTVISAFAFGTGYGASLSSTGNIGMYASTTSGVAGAAVDVNPSSTNTSQTTLQLKRYTSLTATNGIAGRIEFITEPSSGTVDVTSGYIESGWEDATFATRKSFMALYTTLNGSTTRKVNISSSGQQTWDGYPALTAQVDSTTYKPIAIDGSGNVVKMAGWAGAGGGASLNNIGTGFAWAATPGGNIKRVANGYGMLWDSTSTANSLTAKADTSTLKAVYLPIHVNANKIIDQNGFNLYFTGSGQFQSDSVKYTELEAPPAVADMVMLGNSIAYGQGASVPDSSLKNRLSNYYGLTLVDLSLSGSGVWRAASNFYLNVNPGHNNLTVIMAGLNDVRRNAYAAKTHNKIVNGYQGVFINQYMDTWVTATDASVTKIGSWSSGYTSSTVGGKGVNGGILSTTAGDTARWDFTGTSVAVGLMGADSVGGSSYEYGNGKIFIDDVFIMNIREGNQWDGVSDGVNDNKRGTYPLFFTGLSVGSHNIKIVQNDPGVFLVIDYFATLVEPANGKPLILVHAPYLNNAGYATSPNLANNSIIDSLNTLIDSMYTVFTAAGYPVYLSQIENCYDTLTGLSGDNIHPNDVGYRQMFDCTKLAAPSFGTQATKGTIYYANDGFFYGSRDGLPKRLAYVGDTASYILNRTSIAQTAGFKISGTGTAGNFVAPAAALGNVTLASATGVLLAMTPVAGQSLVTVTGNITGNVITNNTNAGATTGLLWVQRNVSNATGAYSALALAVEGSGDGTGSAQFAFRNDGLGREYVMGMDVSNERFEINWGNQAQLNGRHLFALDSNGVVHLRTPPSGDITDSLLVYRASDTSMRMINMASIGATTLYNGDGTLSGNRIVTGSNNSLTFNGIFNYRVNANVFAIDKTTETAPYSFAVAGAPNQLLIGFTPTIGTYSKGSGVIIDTNNNAGLGTAMPTTAPLYAAGTNAYANNLLVEGGVFYGVSNVSSNITLDLEKHFISIDATSGNVTITLPAASTAFGSSIGINYVFQRADNSGNTVTIQRAGSDTINGGTNFTLTTQWEAKNLTCTSATTWGQH